MMRIVVPLVLSSALLLIGCVPQSADPAPSSVPVRPPISPPPPPLAPVTDNWQDVPVTLGGWVWHSDARGSVAMFGVAGMDAQFVARCDLAARRVYLSRPGLLAVGQEAVLAITTSAGTGSYRAQPTGGSPPYIAAQIAATDPFLDKMAFSRGRFVVATTGLARLVIPAWPEFGRVIEDCRK